MKRVNFLVPRGLIIVDYSLQPIKFNRRRLKEKGYSVKIYYDTVKELFECDILCINSKYFSKSWKTPEVVFSFINNARKYCNKIVWFDDSDSTGITHFELLPYIDLYLKKQLLKDRKLYTKKYYGDRIFTDFYHNNYGIVDETPYHSKPIDLRFAHKVGLSWHIGLGNMYDSIMPFKTFRHYGYLLYKIPFRDPQRNKDLDIMSRGSINYTRNTVKFHRQELREQLAKINHLNSALEGRVSIRCYKKEMGSAKLVVSPFGWGEIGVRDFDAFIYGAALVKPDMSHMETWPDVFIPGKTYQPISWGFDDLEKNIMALINDDKKRKEIAKNGQNVYKEIISDKGMEFFCDWFVLQIEK